MRPSPTSDRGRRSGSRTEWHCFQTQMAVPIASGWPTSLSSRVMPVVSVSHHHLRRCLAARTSQSHRPDQHLGNTLVSRPNSASDITVRHSFSTPPDPDLTSSHFFLDVARPADDSQGSACRRQGRNMVCTLLQGTACKVSCPILETRGCGGGSGSEDQTNQCKVPSRAAHHHADQGGSRQADAGRVARQGDTSNL